MLEDADIKFLFFEKKKEVEFVSGGDGKVIS